VHEDVKQWLNRYSEAQADLDDLRARRDALIQRSEAARTSAWDDLPHGKGDHADPTGIMAARIEDLACEIAERIAEARALYSEIDGAIKQIGGHGSADQRCCLQCRYLDGCSWPEVAQILFGRKPDFEEKFDNYLRRTHFIHAKALETLAKLVPCSTDTGNDTTGV